MANEIFTKFRGRSIVDILQRGADKQVASLRAPRNTKINWILNENRKPSDSEISEEAES